jgi:ribonuclease BN (tRNA processing enzyme)
MKIKILGCGNAFSMMNFNQQFLLEENGRKMLIDCGWATPYALEVAKIPVKEINDIYISHLHADHIGGLEYMAFTRYDWMSRPQKWDGTMNHYAPRLIGNEVLLKDLWDKSLRGGLESMEGFVSTLETFFEPVAIKPNHPFMWQGWQVDLIQQIHIMTGSSMAWTFGIILSKPEHKTVYFTTDSQHCSPRQMETWYKKADIIFQDCECLPFMSGVHANYMQLAGYPEANSVVLSADIKKKMWLSHYQDFVTQGKDFFGKDKDWDALAEKDGFAGFVKLGQEFEV